VAGAAEEPFGEEGDGGRDEDHGGAAPAEVVDGAEQAGQQGDQDPSHGGLAWVVLTAIVRVPAWIMVQVSSYRGSGGWQGGGLWKLAGMCDRWFVQARAGHGDRGMVDWEGA